MMFVFLPLMAGVMMLLYWSPRRHYVEHLVFFLHTHSALFLALIFVSLLGIVGFGVSFAKTLSDVAAIVLPAYALWYVYRAMRRYYGQSRLLTWPKYLLLGLVYFLSLIVTVAATLLLSALET